MATTTQTNGQTAAIDKTFGFPGLICPMCGEDAGITINLISLNECHCCECEEDFDLYEQLERMEAAVKAWRAVAKWVALAPSTIEAE